MKTTCVAEAVQMALFQQTENLQEWQALPPTVKNEVTCHLAQMLRSHLRRNCGLVQGGPDDER